MVKRFLCLFAAFIALFWCVAPAFATGVTPGVGVGGLPVGVEIQLDVVDFAEFCRNDLRYVYNSVRHWLDDDICPYAPQASGGHNFVPRRTMVDGQIGKYYVCEYCGKAYGDALEEAYDEYVADTYGSFSKYDGSGNIPIQFAFNGVSGSVYSGGEPYVYSLNVDGSGDVDNKFFCSFLPGEASFSTSGKLVHFNSCNLIFSFVPPISGTFVVSGGSYRFVSFSCKGLNDRSGAVPVSSLAASAGATLRFVFSPDFVTPAYQWTDLRVVYSIDAFIVPYGALGAMYNTDTRIGGNVSDSGTGLYGYVQDGQLYQSTVGTIYNETTNIYQNPVTGETKDVSNWTYDYSDRSYTLTTDEGDTVTVTYGDTNVLINDGGTTYNVYYLTEHDESVSEHYYTSSVTLAPTCTGTGVRTYTCGACGDTYTETIPATGHDYQSSVTLASTCINTGVRTYTCTVCGDTYTETIPLVAHDYQSAVTMPSTCINTGVRTFTCSVCGDAYTVSMPSTGHVWQVVQTVPTVYDEGGQLVTEGYTIYQCATCDEQYKITADSGGASLPSPGGGGTSTDTGASLIELDPHVGRGFLATIAHGLTEDLPEVLKAASAWFTEFPAFYGGFTAFLKDGIAGCLPDIPRKTMGFGLSMVTFIGIVKKIIGR